MNAKASLPPNEEPLAYRAVRGGLWVALNAYWTQGFGFLANLILIRLLMPSDYGVWGLAMFFFVLVNLRPKLGISTAFIQRKETDGDLIGSHLALDLLAALVTLVLGGLAVPILHALGYASEVCWLVFVLACKGGLEALGNTASLLLEKELFLRQTSLLGNITFTVSYLPAIWIALRGGGYWSFVAQNLTAVGLGVIGAWWLLRRRRPQVWQWRWRFNWQLAKELLQFGLFTGLSNLCSTLMFNFDNFAIGTFVNSTVLGYYGQAYSLAEWPNKLVTGVITRTAFYTYTRLQDDKVRLQKAAAMTLWLISIVTLPMALAMLVTSTPLVTFLYEARWLSSAQFLRWLVVYMLLRPLLDNAGMLLTALGKVKGVLGLSVVSALVLILATTVMTYLYGVLGACVGVSLSFLVALGLTWRYLRQFLALFLRDILLMPVIAAILALGVYALASPLINALASWPLLAQIVARAGLVAGVFFVCLFALQPRQTWQRFTYVWKLARGT